MINPDWNPSPRRGTAILLLTIIVLSGVVTLGTIGPGLPFFGSKVRVAVIDSGIDQSGELVGRVVAEKSFIDVGYGYNTSDNSTDDSSPDGTPHGTYVAKTIVSISRRSILINAKVVTSDNTATLSAIADAIYWAVSEQDCDVINLSLGGGSTVGDPVAEAVRWAFTQGVVIVAAAGNSGDGGLGGSTVESPALLMETIAVAAVNDYGDPFDFSSRGPLRNGTAKPDVAAYGYYVDSSGIVYGTSFAAPRVSAVVAELIAYCTLHNWSWTPGMIKALLMASAKHLSHEYYEVGAGLVDLEAAKLHLDNVQKNDGLPMVAWVSPNVGPWDFERWFVNTTALVELSIFASTQSIWTVVLRGSAVHWSGAPDYVSVNQTGTLSIRVRVISNQSITGLDLIVSLSSKNYANLFSRIEFDADLPIARVAFDLTHSPWVIDSIYGQFREFYKIVTEMGISVEEIHSTDQFALDYLLSFDALIILDACTYRTRYSNGSYIPELYRSFSTSEINTLLDYWRAGGSLFVAGLNNQSVDIEAINLLMTQFNMTFQSDRIPTISISINGKVSTALVTDLLPHAVTQGIDSFDYYGCSIKTTGSAYPLAQVRVNSMPNGTIITENRTLLAGMENPAGGRMIATGTNFFLDNWGISGEYRSKQNAKLARQIVLWLVGILN